MSASEPISAWHAHAITTRRTLWAAVFASAFASMSVGILPLAIGMFSDRFSLSLEQSGILASGIQIGTGIGGLLILKIRGLAHWRWLLRGCALVFALVNASAILATSAGVLLSVQLFAGVAGGAAYGLLVYMIGRTPNPDRAYGVMYAVGLAAYAIFALVFPVLRSSGGFPLALNSFGALMVAAGLLASLLPNGDRAAMGREVLVKKSRTRRLSGACSLLGLLLFELGIFAVWAYTERIGSLAGFSAESIGVAVAIGGFAGVAGAATAAAAGSRFGRLVPAGIAAAAVVIANILLWSPASFVGYVAGSCLFNFGWLLGIPFFMGTVVSLDESGALTSLILPAQTTGAVLGPMVAAAAVGTETVNPVLIVSSLACAAALIPMRMAAAPDKSAGVLKT